MVIQEVIEQLDLNLILWVECFIVLIHLYVDL